MNTDEFRFVITCRAHKLGSQQALARELDVSPQYISDVINRRREPSERLANALGYNRRVTFVIDRKP